MMEPPTPQSPPRPSSLWSGAPMTVSFLAEIMDHVAHPIFVKDRAFRFVLLNSALGAMLGIPRETMLGRTDYDFFPKAEADFFRAKDEEMFRTAAEVVIEEEPITDAAGQRHWLSTTKVPLLGADGAVAYLVGIIHDITPLKVAQEALQAQQAELEQIVEARTAELRAAHEELVRRERLAVVGQLSGSIAHQVRNPLGSIKNAAYLIQMAVGDAAEDDVRRAVEIIHDEVGRANQIISDLLDYARVRPPQRRSLPLGYVLAQALAGQRLGGVAFVQEVPEALQVCADPDQLQTALRNLLRNAVDAMPDGGKLTVRTELTVSHLCILVEDTGQGIADEVRDRLFEPVVSTKPLSLGLGLLTARTLIENQGGSLRCERPAEGGTRFVVSLPLA